MDEEKKTNSQIPTEKIYNDKKIGVGTFLGGPLVAGYFIAQNFKEFGESGKVKLTWAISIIVTIIVFTMAFAFENLPNQVLPIIYTTITYFLVRSYQGKKIDSHIEKNGQVHSWWRVVGVSILILVLTIVVVLGVFFATMPTEKSKIYEDTKTEITYLEQNIPEIEVDSIANALKKAGIYNDKTNSYFYVNKVNKTYEISINYLDPKAIDEELLGESKRIKNDLQKYFPNNKIVINLISNDISNVIKRIE